MKKKKGKYSLYERDGYFYYRTYDQQGKRTSGRSTHQTSQSAARTFVENLIAKGPLPIKGDPTFGTFTENWFVWEKCYYVMAKRQSGQIGRTYVEGQRSYLVNHIRPTFKDIRLSKIDKEMVLRWLRDLANKKSKMSRPLSKVTINHCLRILKLILEEAEDQGLIYRNPARSVGRMKKELKRRVLPTPSEFQSLFDEKTISTVWGGDKTLYTINLLAATTGMRLGEIQALQRENIESDHIRVVHSWERKYGLKGTKTNTPRFTMTFSRLEKWIGCTMGNTDGQEPSDLLFPGTDRSVPISPKAVADALYSALDKIGITEAIRKERGITFHAWRHFFITNMRPKLAEWKLNKLTGHSSNNMADHYTTLRPEDCEDVRKIQEELFG